MEKVTTEIIIDFLKEMVENKQPIAPGLWVDSAVKLNILLGDEQEHLFNLQQKVAQLKIDFLNDDEKRNVSKAKMMVEASEEYREARNQQAKIDRIVEFIRLAKVQSRISEDEKRGY